MAQGEYSHAKPLEMAEIQTGQIVPTNNTIALQSEEEILADVDEPPDQRSTPRPALNLSATPTTSFSKTTPQPLERKQSLLTNALHSNQASPTEEHSEASALSRGLSCASTWSNGSMASTAELTSDGGFTSPGTRTSTPSPPLPSTSFHRIVPIFNKTPFQEPLSIVRHDDENVGPLQKSTVPTSGETTVEANLGRKRCISFACGPKATPKAAPKPPSIAASTEEPVEQPKRQCTIKFACPTKVSTDAPLQSNKPRLVRPVSPAPLARMRRASPKASPKSHRDSDSTVRNTSPISVRKPAHAIRRNLSVSSDLVKSEAGRFHEFASSEEEVDEWLQESTCHRNRLTISDTLKIENGLRQLGEEVEEEVLEDEQDQDEDDEDDGPDDEEDLEDDEDDLEDYDASSDEGFQTDDEGGFATSDEESDAGSDYQWWNPGYSTAATSIEQLEHIRPSTTRSMSESSTGSVDSVPVFSTPFDKTPRRRKARPVNIRVPSPELPDSTDFVCGTLDEDRPLEDAYLSCLERRRAAKHKVTPQDIDPSFPTSDPEMDDEDEDEDDEPDNAAEESDQPFMMHGQMDPPETSELRGRRKDSKKSPTGSPKRLRSPPPTKRPTLRSPPPRRLFGQSPKRQRSPAPIRLRSPPPTRRGSEIASPRRPGLSVHFGALAERNHITMSSSAPRTPVSALPHNEADEEEDYFENPTRRAIDIKIGLENKRQRRKEKLYQKIHRKGSTKDKKPPPGKGCERMREMGLGLAAHKGKSPALKFSIPPTPDQKDLHVLSF